jgi:hypothetical protein
LLLGRSAGAVDFRYWGEVLSSQGSGAVALGIQQSLEHRQRQITLYYSTLVHRQTPAPDGGVQYWLNTGLDLLGVRIGFGASPEFFENG